MNLFHKVPIPKQSYSYQFINGGFENFLDKATFVGLLDTIKKPMISIVMPKYVFSFQQNEIKESLKQQETHKLQSVFFIKILKSHANYSFYRTETIEVLTSLEKFKSKNPHTMIYHLEDINKKNPNSKVPLLSKEFKYKSSEYIENESLTPYLKVEYE